MGRGPGDVRRQGSAVLRPNLIADIRSRRTDHEICTHTYSHVDCDEVDSAVVEWELDRARKIHERYGLSSSESIVPPRHGTPPADVLADGGIRVKRAPHYQAPGETRPSSDVRKLYEILLERHPTVEPHETDGVLETYSPEYTTLAVPYLQTGTYEPHPVYRPIPRTLRWRLHAWSLRRGVDAAAGGGSAHHWCQLYGLSNEQQWPQIDSFLAYLADRRDHGDVKIRTMREIAADFDRFGKIGSAGGDSSESCSRYSVT